MNQLDLEALPAPYRALFDELSAALPPDRLVVDPLRLLALGTDASFYRLTPRSWRCGCATRPRSSGCSRPPRSRRLPVTFRAAGTSLSGQAVSDSVLVILSGGFRDREILDAGGRIRLGPGVIGAEANALLAPLGRKIGPDPASIGACMVGGIVANNASGMCCGTAQNSYQTVTAMQLLLADGTRLDSADPASRAAFRAAHPEILDGLAALRDEIRADAALAERIRRKYRIKNTTGYSLNAFVDYRRPDRHPPPPDGRLGGDAGLHLRGHLPDRGGAGPQGQRAHPLPGHRARRPRRAAARPAGGGGRRDHGPGLAAEPWRAGRGCRPAWPGSGPRPAPCWSRSAPPRPRAARRHRRRRAAALAGVPTLGPVVFTADRAAADRLWDVRRGLFPAVGAARRIGTTVIIEDVAFPMEHLAAGTVELQQAFARHGYAEGIIFGHALDGNLHFVFTQDFGDPAEVARYQAFLDDVCQMVAARFDGSLKAEHGTGRNMAPFVELEWGPAAYSMMKRVKALLDPHGLLNPGVIINDDPRAHLKDLKPLPPADAIIDRCIECGFCEPKCPSRTLTATPRQRITVARELARLRRAGDDAPRLARLAADFRYWGEETCATDGLCATACPVGIDTGEYVKKLRAADRGGLARAVASAVAANLGAVSATIRIGLGALRTLRKTGLGGGGAAPPYPGPVHAAPFLDESAGRGPPRRLPAGLRHPHLRSDRRRPRRPRRLRRGPLAARARPATTCASRPASPASAAASPSSRRASPSWATPRPGSSRRRCSRPRRTGPSRSSATPPPACSGCARSSPRA